LLVVDSSIQASRSARAIRFCIGKFDPDGRVIACPLAAPHIAIDHGRDQAVGDGRAQQKMIDAQPGVAGKGVPKILPESVDPLIRVESPQRVGPALLDKSAIGLSHLGPKNRASSTQPSPVAKGHQNAPVSCSAANLKVSFGHNPDLRGRLRSVATR
jgi:hypothetical protein